MNRGNPRDGRNSNHYRDTTIKARPNGLAFIVFILSLTKELYLFP